MMSEHVVLSQHTEIRTSKCAENCKNHPDNTGHIILNVLLVVLIFITTSALFSNSSRIAF